MLDGEEEQEEVEGRVHAVRASHFVSIALKRIRARCLRDSPLNFAQNVLDLLHERNLLCLWLTAGVTVAAHLLQAIANVSR